MSTRNDLINQHSYLEAISLYYEDDYENIITDQNLYWDEEYRKETLSDAFYKAINNKDINYGILDLLLYLGANVDINYSTGFMKGITPLIIASMSKDPNLTQYLLENGANPNHLDGNNYSPLMHTAIAQRGNLFLPYGNWEIESKEYQTDAYTTAKYLLQYGANLRYRTLIQNPSTFLSNLLSNNSPSYSNISTFDIALRANANQNLLNLLQAEMHNHLFFSVR
jgi:ankyrin repeat protein